MGNEILDILETPESNFEESTFEEILSNESDVLCGVNRVQKNFSNLYFKVFPNCLIKHHDSGEVKYVFYTVTHNVDHVFYFSRNLFKKLGTGYFDDTKHRSFTETDRVIALSKGIFFSEKDDHVQVWLYNDITLLLQYRTSPLCQLALMITIKPEKTLDRSIRRRGTIFDFLKFNIHELLGREEIAKVKTFEEGDFVSPHLLPLSFHHLPSTIPITILNLLLNRNLFLLSIQRYPCVN